MFISLAQRKLLFLAALLVAVIGMFPPYNARTECVYGKSIPERQQEYPFGNFFFLLNVAPPYQTSEYCATSVRIDTQRLYARWATSFFVFALLWLALWKKQDGDNEEIAEQLFEIRKLLTQLSNK